MILAFPNIDDSRPQGTEYVSTIDDFERETRTWLKQCMLTITGYPNVDTVAVKAWTNGTRPSNLTNNYLLGFNTDTNSLEVLNPSSAIVDHISLAQQVALIVYPVGSYYETSDANFDPNTAWGGTWVKDSEGKVLVATGTGFSLGETGGAKQVSIVENNVPRHNHEGHTHPHSHTAGTLTVTGHFGATNEMKERVGGAFYYDSSWSDPTYFCGLPNGTEAGYLGKMIRFDSSRSGGFTGNTSQDSTEATGGYFGKNPVDPLQTMPPYVVVVRWHRTA